MDRRANTREGTTIQGQLVSLIIFIVKNDSIINLFLSSSLSIFCVSFKRPMRSNKLNGQSITCTQKKKVNLLQQLNILLCACVHVCIRAFCVAVLGACSASPSAHGSCIISSEHATATGILRLCCWKCFWVFVHLTHRNPDLILSCSTLARAIGGNVNVSVCVGALWFKGSSCPLGDDTQSHSPVDSIEEQTTKKKIKQARRKGKIETNQRKQHEGKYKRHKEAVRELQR